MSGIPRTGLFARNHLASLTQRNRALQTENVNSNDNVNVNVNEVKESGAGVAENSPIASPASSSFASLPRDNEGFDDLDAYFNRSSTPKKTPSKDNNNKLSSTSKKLSSALQNTPIRSRSGSRAETPLTQRTNANVLLAKPVKMIASKFAERYKKEPRLAVSMSEAIEETREREREIEREREEERELEQEDEGEIQNDLTQESLLEPSENQDQDQDQDQQGHLEPELISEESVTVEDRIQKAKRELEEMSINSFDSSINYENQAYSNDDTEVHLSSYIKSRLNNVVTNKHQEDKHNNNNNNFDYSMPNDEDVLMDRLVEEMLVNDSDLPDPIEVKIKNGNESEEEIKPVKSVKSARTSQQRKPRSSGGLTRRPANYLPGAEYTETGQRRSCRLKIEPLKYWANEKVCYGRADDPSITLPVIVNIIKKPELDDPTFAMGLTRKRKSPVNGNISKLKAQAFGPDCDVETEVNCYDRPGEEELRLVALSHHHVQGDPVKDCSFRIHTIFTEGTYMSSGQLIFPPLSQKPTKNSARHALVFYVIAGSFRIEINRESFVIGPGGQFHVPRANHYTITHITEDRSIEGRLFFCHCKDNAE